MVKDLLQQRYACKAMNGKVVEEAKIQRILDAITLAPSSLGLQLYKVFVVTNDKLKKELREAAFGQQVIEGCSHLLVFAARTEVEEKDYEAIAQLLKKVRNYDEEKAQRYIDRLCSFVDNNVAKHQAEWLIHQTYIALGVACVAAAEEKVDTVPVEGFNKAEVDRILGLTEKGYKSTLLFPIGYSDNEHDWMYNVPKIRKTGEDFIEYYK